MDNFTTTYGNSVADAAPVERAAFIRRTYTLLAVAVLAFIAVEAVFFATPIAGVIASLLFSGGSIGWLVVLGLFMGISYLANSVGSLGNIGVDPIHGPRPVCRR